VIARQKSRERFLNRRRVSRTATNASTWKYWQGRSEARCQSVAGPQGEAQDGPSRPDRDASRDRAGFAGASGRSPEQERTFSRCATPQDSQLARQSSPCRNIRGGLRPRGSAAASCLSPLALRSGPPDLQVQVAGCAAASVHDLVSDHAQRIGTNHHLIPRPQIHPGIPEIVRPEDHPRRRAGEDHRARGNVSGGIE